jgi:hypothetical protein
MGDVGSLCNVFIRLEMPDAEVTYHFMYDNLDKTMVERLYMSLLWLNGRRKRIM